MCTFAHFIVYTMQKTFYSLFLVGIVAALLTGCVTQKQMTYLQDANSSIEDSINAKFQAHSETVIRVGDALTIFVSALDQEAVTPYNMPTAIFASPGTTQVQTTPMLQYYTVGEDGTIVFPVLGSLHVAGLQRNEVEDLIKEKLEAQIVNPLVQVHLVGAKVSVLGEVARPGAVAMTNGRMTILEALAAAGDMTPYGKRDNVLITREIDGKLQIQRVDLRSSDLYTSPFYYLQQNDVVYVAPNKVRAISSANAGLWLSVVSTVASAATVIVTVVNASKTAPAGSGSN